MILNNTLEQALRAGFILTVQMIVNDPSDESSMIYKATLTSPNKTEVGEGAGEDVVDALGELSEEVWAHFAQL